MGVRITQGNTAMRIVRTALLLTLLTPLAACASGALMVEKAPTKYQASSATLVYEPAMVEVEENTQAYLQRKMDEVFFTGTDAVFKQGTDMTVRYQIVGHNEGSRIGRYLTGGLAGGSKSYIMATFYDSTAQQIGQVRAEGSVGGGLAGGSAKSGIDKAVKEIAEYAAKTFKR